MQTASRVSFYSHTMKVKCVTFHTSLLAKKLIFTLTLKLVSKWFEIKIILFLFIFLELVCSGLLYKLKTKFGCQLGYVWV